MARRACKPRPLDNARGQAFAPIASLYGDLDMSQIDVAIPLA